MSVGCSIKGIADISRPGQGIGDLLAAGYESVMLDMGLYHPEYVLEYLGQKRKIEREIPDVRILTEALKRRKLRVSVVKAPKLMGTTKRTDLNETLLKLAKESIRIAKEMEADFVWIPPLTAGVVKAQEWEINQAFYLELARECKGEKLRILLSNQAKNQGGHLIRGICSDGEKAVQWLERLNREVGEERFGFCLDVGICTICSQSMRDMIGVLREHLKVVVLRDCDGTQDEHLLPFTSAARGTSDTDWLSLIRGLREIEYQGEYILDGADTASAFSVMLRPHFLRLAKETGDYIRWQVEMEHTLRKYSKVVLFGAGRMCFNYMHCYGKKYPPLFTCDNNPALWGTKCGGLEVKPPEALRELPEDCVVMICNIYYREIEQQLKEMGIQNIDFFNDEYLPGFV